MRSLVKLFFIPRRIQNNSSPEINGPLTGTAVTTSQGRKTKPLLVNHPNPL